MKRNQSFFLIIFSLALSACQMSQPVATTAVVNNAPTVAPAATAEKPVIVTKASESKAAPATVMQATAVQPTVKKIAPTPTWASKVVAAPCQQGCVWKIEDQPDLYSGYGDITVDRQGNIIVTDGNNPHILKLDPNGKLLAKWGSMGVGDGQFLTIILLATDKEGNVYVTDTNNFRVQKFDPNGKFLMKFGAQGKGPGQFQYPGGLVVDDQGNIYVGDGALGGKDWKILKFDSTGKFMSAFGNPGNTPFNLIFHMIIDKQGNLYVDDFGNMRIVKLDPRGTPLSTTQWCGKPDETASYMSPLTTAMDNNGNQYVLDGNNARICTFGPDGQFLSTWGVAGTKENELSKPSGMEIDQQGNMYILDGDIAGEVNARIRKFVKP